MTREKQFAVLAASLMALIALCGAPEALGVEHPGTLDYDADCSTCHISKMTGRSVHSVMSSPCTVCHVAMRRGDMTVITLSMPKGKICFACHQESAALQQHVPSVKGQCVQCHDAHSSERRMLLLADEVSALKKK